MDGPGQAPHVTVGKWRPREREWLLKVTQQISGPGGIDPEGAGLGACWEGGLSAKGLSLLSIKCDQVEENVLGDLEREFIEGWGLCFAH